MNTKKFTILHSNDMHGDFLAEEGQDKLVGGLALLSGYINKVRKEEKNVFYLIAGDMLQGSVIDTEYKGISTIDIMNYLAPDVVALGNHEFDYGLPHLLFLEKVANFPIVNANLYIKSFNKRLMKPYVVLKKAGFDILFTGIVTEKIIDALARDKIVGSFVTLKEAGNEVGKICNAYKNDDIDLTILLTHIGFESDKKLAKILKPEWGVDMIIGGHSHTVLDQPEKINNILIAQAGVGTNQIGRFDIIVDDDTNSIVEWNWQLVPITSDIAKPDEKLVAYIDSYKQVVDRKYNSILCKMAKKLTHPKREIETALGNLFADAFSEIAQCDVAFIGSGSIRTKEMGPLVTLQDFMTSFPYDDTYHRFTISGSELFSIFEFIMRPDNRKGEGECYQINEGVEAIYDEKEKKLLSLKIKKKPVENDKFYSIGVAGYHYNCSATYLDMTQEKLNSLGKSKVVTTSMQEVMEEFLRNNQNISNDIEGRLVYKT
ncbi:bifunctional metallophosphatase/5'-nucleotidase [archaeon]|jgi:5'-nucleotidase / UDP-sugar diphosphatase|nr:bifunctional metallophosphatase/5'-nucleotidase [archaeon]MBT4647386.1 bifunctional metallophosphatase/5'-nucleotidase [archaeon]MBT6821389.1 bifunctional metallophosphatase/5'-nucleotidase [archaeon]MBT7392842.1 bifunctional metallophosphatase/5'-nucleotidase [archaeon]